ncbi:MAG: type III secretion protein HrpB4 [Burkholderiaceae bacterium]
MNEEDVDPAALLARLLAAARRKSADVAAELHPAWIERGQRRLGLAGRAAADARWSATLAEVYDLRWPGLDRLAPRAHRIALLARTDLRRALAAVALQGQRHRVRMTIGAAARTRLVGLVGEPAYRRLMEAPSLRPTTGGAFGVQELDADRLAAVGLGRLIASRLWFDKRLLAWARLAIAPVSEVPPSGPGHADEALEDLPTYFPEHAWLFGSSADRALSASSTA